MNPIYILPAMILSIVPAVIIIACCELWEWFNRQPMVMSIKSGEGLTTLPSLRQRFAAWRRARLDQAKVWLEKKIDLPKPDVSWIGETAALLWIFDSDFFTAITLIQIAVIFVGATNLHNMTIIWALVAIEMAVGVLCVCVGWQWQEVIEKKI